MTEGLRDFLGAQWWKKISVIYPFVLEKSSEVYIDKAMVQWGLFGKAIKVLYAYVFLSHPNSEIRQTPAF